MSRRVLVVEPSRTIRTLLEIYLQQSGHQVALFASYAEAGYALTLPQFRTNPPEVVFVAMNTSWPESSRFIEELRRRPHGALTKIVVMVTQEEHTHQRLQRLRQDGQVISLIKPFRVQDALALVSTPT
jgi:CheY-like chemotaxis protein